MVILFRGTATSDHHAPELCALHAGTSAIRYDRRTLVLQFSSRKPVENLLTGKRKQEIEIMSESYEFNDVGIDSLLRKLRSSRLDKEQFDLCTTTMLKRENALDVAEVSKKPDFEKEIEGRPEDIKELLEAANKVYDDIVLLANGKNLELVKILNELSDISVICISQGEKEDIPEPGKDWHIVITDFDNASSYDINRMKKIYGVKRIDILPYNTGFKDACHSKDILQYVLVNSKNGKTDDNEALTDAIFSFSKHVLNRDFPEDNDGIPEGGFPRLERHREVPNIERTLLSGKNVRYTKGFLGLFRRKETNGYEVSLNGFEDEATGEEYLNNPEGQLAYEEQAGDAKTKKGAGKAKKAKDKKPKKERIKKPKKKAKIEEPADEGSGNYEFEEFISEEEPVEPFWEDLPEEPVDIETPDGYVEKYTEEYTEEYIEEPEPPRPSKKPKKKKPDVKAKPLRRGFSRDSGAQDTAIPSDFRKPKKIRREA